MVRLCSKIDGLEREVKDIAAVVKNLNTQSMVMIDLILCYIYYYYIKVPVKEEGSSNEEFLGVCTVFFYVQHSIHVYYSQANGVNLLRIPARDAYAYGLSLVDAIFTKEELAQSLFMKSKKSDKPALDKGKVDKIIGERK